MWPSCENGIVNTTNKSSVCCCQPVSSHTSHFTLLPCTLHPHLTPPPFLFYAKAWNELAWVCLSGSVRWRIRGWGLGVGVEETWWKLLADYRKDALFWRQRPWWTLGPMMSWYSLRFVSASCWISREGSSHAPKTYSTLLPPFPHSWKSVSVCLSVRHSSRTLPSKSQSSDKPPPNNGCWLSERSRQRQFPGWPDWSVKQQPRKCWSKKEKGREGRRERRGGVQICRERAKNFGTAVLF